MTVHDQCIQVNSYSKQPFQIAVLRQTQRRQEMDDDGSEFVTYPLSLGDIC
jgi:hypothetical protein